VHQSGQVEETDQQSRQVVGYHISDCGGLEL
jgi:hypothetical protein